MRRGAIRFPTLQIPLGTTMAAAGRRHEGVGRRGRAGIGAKVGAAIAANRRRQGPTAATLCLTQKRVEAAALRRTQTAAPPPLPRTMQRQRPLRRRRRSCRSGESGRRTRRRGSERKGGRGSRARRKRRRSWRRRSGRRRGMRGGRGRRRSGRGRGRRRRRTRWTMKGCASPSFIPLSLDLLILDLCVAGHEVEGASSSRRLGFLFTPSLTPSRHFLSLSNASKALADSSWTSS